MRDHMTLTQHAQVRMQQRGFRDGDLRLLLELPALRSLTTRSC